MSPSDLGSDVIVNLEPCTLLLLNEGPEGLLLHITRPGQRVLETSTHASCRPILYTRDPPLTAASSSATTSVADPAASSVPFSPCEFVLGCQPALRQAAHDLSAYISSTSSSDSPLV